MSNPAEIKVLKFAEIVPKFSPRGSSLHQHFGDKEGASMASGFAIFKDCEIPWKLWYDEMLLCFSADGRFDIVIDNVVHQMVSGDMVWLPAGTDLIYRSAGTTHAVWAVTPPDWDKRQPKA